MSLKREIYRAGPWFHQIEIGGLLTRDIHPTKGPQPRDHPRQRWDLLVDRLPELGGKKVLDAGAADGFFSVEMAKRGAEVTAVDNNPRRVARLDFVADKTGLPIRPIKSSVYDLTPDLGRFDFILFLAVLYHLVHPILGLQKLAALGDTVMLETVARRKDPKATLVWGPSTGKVSYDGWIPSVPCVIDMLNYAGFEDVEEIGEHKRPIFLARK